MGFKKFLRVIILLFSYIILISGIILGIIVVTGGFAGISIILDMFLPQVALVAFIYLIVMVLVVRLKWGQKKWLVFTLFAGFIAFGLNIVPLFGVQSAIGSAESQFNTTFGNDWNELIPNELEAKFRAAPFDMGEYLNGIPSSSCNVSYDIEYAFVNGNDSLRFDVYLPLTGVGPFPTIITIHGGGWTSGNKGTSNLAYVNRYLASQGYAVFDIIYGLAQAGLAGAEAIGIDKLTGSGSVNYNNSYTIPQMVKNIGTFTHYLAAHAQEFKVNLSQVFVLGRSAGAHLAGCVVLGFDDAPYSSVFNHSITILGGILYYPPCNMTTMFANSLKIAAPYRSFVDVQEMFDYLMESNATNYWTYSPRSYVKANSPPLLIFHGSNDKLVPTGESRDLKSALESVGNTDCILIEMPFMGHAFDMIPGNPYSQITYYYLERFLALTLITTT